MSSSDPLDEEFDEELDVEVEEDELDELDDELEELLEDVLLLSVELPLLQLAKTLKMHMALNRGGNCISFVPITSAKQNYVS